jgi:hypothetical protein
MLTDDYLIRMINLAIAALLRITGLKKKEDYEEALQLIDLTLEQLVGLRSNLIRHMEDEKLFYVLTRQDRLDTQRLELIADLLQQEGDIFAIQNRLVESREDYSRALKYYLEVSFHEPVLDISVLGQKIDQLVKILDLRLLGADVLWPLSAFYEENGAYSQAEESLLRLMSLPGLEAEILPELIAFYERMLHQPPAALGRGGLTLVEVRKKLGQRKRF